MTARSSPAEPYAGGSLQRRALATYGTNALAVVLSLLNVLVVARALGAAGRGEVALLITIAGLTGQAAALGIQEANARLGGPNAGARPKLVTNSLIFAAVLGIAAAAALGALGILVPAIRANGSLLAFGVCVGTIPLLLLRMYLSFLVQSDFAFAVSNIAWLLGPLTALTINATAAAAGRIDVASATAAWSAGQAGGALLLVLYAVRRFGLGRPNAALALESIAFGSKTHLGRFMALGNYRMDQWLLGVIAGPRELGLYSVAVAWAEVLFYIPGVLLMTARPRIVRLAPAAAGLFAARMFRVGLMMSSVAAGLLLILAPVLCIAIFGSPFAGSVDDLRVLALAAFGILGLEILGGALTAQGHPLATTGAIATAFGVTLALDLILIPRLGGLGAALATAAAWTIGAVVVTRLFQRTLGVAATSLVPQASDISDLLRGMRVLVHRVLGRQ